MELPLVGYRLPSLNTSFSLVAETMSRLHFCLRIFMDFSSAYFQGLSAYFTSPLISSIDFLYAMKSFTISTGFANPPSNSFGKNLS